MKKIVSKATVAPAQAGASKPSLNRAAFLLGLYAELPAVDSIVEPLVRLSPMLSISKVLLLDAALARLGEYDVESHMLSCKSPFGGRTSLGEDSQRFEISRALYFFELRKVKTIAGLLWEGQTELADWYRTGMAVGSLINAHDNSDGSCMPEAISRVCECLKQAASHWGGDLISESGSGLEDWLTELDDQSKRKKDPKTNAKNTDGNEQHLRAVESLASQIQDRQPEDTHNEEQQLRDARDEFIYEELWKGGNNEAVRRLVNQKITAENLKWPIIGSKADVRSFAKLYADRFNMPPAPAGKAGRPSVKSGNKSRGDFDGNSES